MNVTGFLSLSTKGNQEYSRLEYGMCRSAMFLCLQTKLNAYALHDARLL